MKQKIVIVSHCFLNDAAKLRNQDAADMEQERTKKRSFLRELLERGIEVIQLPCPEFILYGCNRWGHAASQFDTPHFRQEARNMLLPIVMQLEEYAAYPDRYDILGVLRHQWQSQLRSRLYLRWRLGRRAWRQGCPPASWIRSTGPAFLWMSLQNSWKKGIFHNVSTRWMPKTVPYKEGRANRPAF